MMMSSLANSILFLALVTTSIMVAIMYRKLRTLDHYHAEYKQVFDKTGEALQGAQRAVLNFSTEGKETLNLLSMRIDEAKALAHHLEALSRAIGQQVQPYPGKHTS